MTERTYEEIVAPNITAERDRLRALNAGLVAALKPFAKLAEVADNYINIGGWRFVAQHSSTKPDIEITSDDVFKARAYLARLEREKSC